MGINRVIYNTQGLFVAPRSGEQTAGRDYFLSNHRILKRIEKLQSFNYSIQKNESNIQTFGQKQNTFRGQGLSPEVSFNFSYIPDGITNEDRLNFNVNHFSGIHFSGANNLPMFSGICSNSIDLNNRDFYLVINKNNDDIFSDNAAFNNSIVNPSNLNQIIDSNSRNYDLIHFQDCYLDEYSFNVSVNDLPTVNQSYIADNIIYYASGSGIRYSFLELKSGSNIQNHETIVIPKSLNYKQTALSGQNILLPGDASVSFSTNNTGVLFHTDIIQSVDFNINFNRKAYRSINYKLPLLRKIEFPVNGVLNTSFIVDQTLSGSFFDTLNRDDDYNIIINFNNNCKAGVDRTRFIFSGCKFNNINYDSSIGSNKTANLSFNFDLDPDFGRRGIFASGNILYGMLNNHKKVLIF